VKPNIVYIFADDMGYGDLSCQNPESKIDTPTLDGIAARGVRFEDAHAASSVCSPSRYALLTGRYAWRGRLKSGVLGGYSHTLIEAGRLTVGDLLRDHGYHTACIGKWHLGWEWQMQSAGGSAQEMVDPAQVDFSKPILEGPTTRGFDTFFGISASLDMAPYCYVRDDRVTTVPDGWVEHSPYNAFWREGPISPDFTHMGVLPRLAEEAVRYVHDRATSDEPFFLYMPLNGPHTPILPTPEFQGRSGAGDYGDFVMQCDDVVRQVLEALEATGQAEDTLFIFTSDNGAERIAYERAQETGHYSMGQLRGLKRDLWDGGHRVPFVAVWPGRIPAGSVCGETVCLTDLLATVADLLGVALPADAGEDSLSMLPLLTGAGPAPAGREGIVHHSCSGAFAVRKGGWVLIDAPTGDDNGQNGEPAWMKAERGYADHDQPGELFHVADDIAEARNLYAERPDKVAELKALLDTIRAEGRSVTR